MMFNIATAVTIALATVAVTTSVEAKPLGSHCHFDNILVFGDSYSDKGNVYKLSNKTWPLQINDHGRFSNGRVWAEHVARNKQLTLKDYAFGGATSDNDLVQGYTGAESEIPVPGLIQQIDQYYTKHPLPKHSLETAVFVLHLQGNDYFFDPKVHPTQVVGNIAKGIDKLVSLGAQNILVIENIDLGMFPFYQANSTLSDTYTKLSEAQHKALDDLEAKMAHKYGPVADAKYPFRSRPTCNHKNRNKHKKDKVIVGFYRLNELMDYLRQPKVLKQMGITDLVHGCVSSDYKTVCKDADKHFFWDGFHPSAKVHKAIGDAVSTLL
ncbi:hypothetical protein FBU30_006867 [Linnemannia zychae]|nr:hypothetical protein FBU30_006867 [Linnemannia zychae]